MTVTTNLCIILFLLERVAYNLLNKAFKVQTKPYFYNLGGLLEEEFNSISKLLEDKYPVHCRNIRFLIYRSTYFFFF